MQRHCFQTPLPHPGEILHEDFMVPLGLTVSGLAADMGLQDERQLLELIAARSPMSTDMASRLERALHASAQFWLNLQTQHDGSTALRHAPDGSQSDQ